MGLRQGHYVDNMAELRQEHHGCHKIVMIAAYTMGIIETNYFVNEGGMAEHISKQFHSELENVRSKVLQMGGLVEQQLSQTMAALEAGSLEPLLAAGVADAAINAMEVSIDDECQLIIARRQPAAGDLRLVLTVSRVIVDLERIGDEVKKVASKGHQLLSQRDVKPAQFYDFNRMAAMALAMLRRSLDAFARLDTSAAVELKETDEHLDQEYHNQLRLLVTYMMEDPRTIGALIDVLFMLKAIERVGDHAKNITEHVVYLAKGVDVRHVSLDEMKKIM